MKTIICTLFENHYHYGIAALINSLHNSGFKGEIFAGYKRTLPEWTINNGEINAKDGTNTKKLNINNTITIHFIEIDTDFHLANYKPYFMLQLIAGPASEAEAIVYLDPDIIIKCKWKFYELWMQNGVALVHDLMSNDMPSTHPIRLEWDKFIKSNNLQSRRELTAYINSGFCGVIKKYYEFIQIWACIMDLAIKNQLLDPKNFAHSIDRSDIFFAKDQDAFNMAAMVCKSPISEIGPEGMDFIHGGFTMSHAIGSPKPWKKNYIFNAVKGITPSLADHKYWQNVTGPIHLYKSREIKFKRISLLLASFIGRFYSRS